MWSLSYHPLVRHDLEEIPRKQALLILKAIEERLRDGEPEQVGKPLSGNLSGYRRLRVGDFRIVYKVHQKEEMVFIMAIGMRRDEEVYFVSKKRVN